MMHFNFILYIKNIGVQKYSCLGLATQDRYIMLTFKAVTPKIIVLISTLLIN
jgi:hypothetical protein